MPMYNPAAAGALLSAPSKIAFTANTTNGSAVLASPSSTAGLLVGQAVTGAGIETGAVITSLSPLTLSKAVTGSSANGVALTAYVAGADGSISGVPSPARGLVYTDDGWDHPQGYRLLYNYRNHQVRRFAGARAKAVAGKFGGQSTTSTGQPAAASSNILLFGSSQIIGNTPESPTIPKRLHAPVSVAGMVASAAGEVDYEIDNFINVSEAGRYGGASAFIAGDPRYTTIGNGWNVDNCDPSIISCLLNVGTVSSIVYTPAKAFDSIRLIFRDAGDGVASYQIDSGSVVNVTNSNADGSGLKIVNVTGLSLAVHQVTIRYVSGAIRYVGAIPADSTKFRLNLLNFGFGGGGIVQHAQYLAGGLTPAKFITNFAPSLIVHQWGYDLVSNHDPIATALPNFFAKFKIVTDQWKAAGVDQLILSATPWDDTNLYKDDAPQMEYLQGLKDFCRANDLPMVDLMSRWGPWRGATDFVTHYARPDPAGNADTGRSIARALSLL